MQRQRGEWVPIGEVVSGLDDVLVPGDPLRLAPGACTTFTQADQVNQLPRTDYDERYGLTSMHRKGTACGTKIARPCWSKVITGVMHRPRCKLAGFGMGSVHRLSETGGCT